MPTAALCVTTEDGNLIPARGKDRVVLGSCRDEAAEFVIFEHNYIKHVPSGRCFHLRTSPVVSGAELSIRALCTGIALRFQPIRLMYYQKPAHKPKPPDTKLVHHTSGLCATPTKHPDNDNLMIQLRGCRKGDDNGNFRLTERGEIIHTASGRCIEMPKLKKRPDDDTPLMLGPHCNDPRVHFTRLANGAFMHNMSAKCIHPRGGGTKPRGGTVLTIYQGCEVGDRIKFKFLIDR